METRGLFGIIYVPFLSLFPLLEPIFLKHVFSEQKQENLFWYACVETFFFFFLEKNQRIVFGWFW